MKILLVDDSAFSRKVTAAAIRNEGHEVIEAVNGMDGLEAAAAHAPDLIISDILMPRMDGFRFLRALKSDAALMRIPLLFFSVTYTGKKEKELAANLGAAGFIEKPSPPEAFWPQVKKILEDIRAGEKTQVVAELKSGDEEFLRRYIEIVNDKLEKKVAELEAAKDALKSTQERLQQVLSYSPAVIYSCDVEPPHAVTFISDNVQTLTGHEVREFMETPAFKLDRVHPADRTAFLAGFAGLMKEGRSAIEYRFLSRDGSYRWLLDEMKLARSENGEPVEIVGYWADITLRKRTEEALQKSESFVRSILESVDEGFIVINSDYKILSANKAYCAQVGLPVEKVVDAK